MLGGDNCQDAARHSRHPEVAAQRPSKGNGPGASGRIRESQRGERVALGVAEIEFFGGHGRRPWRTPARIETICARIALNSPTQWIARSP